MAWGSVFANTKHYSNPLKAADCLVHECTHALLFALSLEEPLVKNPVDECYPSPLRRDLRPMDGIFHATMVCARLSEFYHILLNEENYKGSSEDLLMNLLKKNIASYQAGMESIDEHALQDCQQHR